MAQSRNRRPQGAQRSGGSTRAQQKKDEDKQPSAEELAKQQAEDELRNDNDLAVAYGVEDGKSWGDLEHEERQQFANALKELDAANEDDDDDDEGEGGEPTQKDLNPAGGDALTNPDNPADREDEPKDTYSRGRPEGIILKQGEKLRIPGVSVGNMITVTEDVYREVVPFRSKRSTFVQLYFAGQQLPANSVEVIEDDSDSDDE